MSRRSTALSWVANLKRALQCLYGHEEWPHSTCYLASVNCTSAPRIISIIRRKFLCQGHTKASCVWLRRCRFCSRSNTFFRELIRNSTCLVSVRLGLPSIRDMSCTSKMSCTWFKCNSTASDSRSIRERKTLQPFNLCMIEDKSRLRGSTTSLSYSLRPVSFSISLISLVQCSSSRRVKLVSKSMISTGKSNGCKAYEAIRVMKRLIRGMDSSLDSEVQCR